MCFNKKCLLIVINNHFFMTDIIEGADSCAIIYSITEIVKADNLKPYYYFEYFLKEITNHLGVWHNGFCENSISRSDKFLRHYKKSF